MMPKMEDNCRIEFQSAFFDLLQFMKLCCPTLVVQVGASVINMGSRFCMCCGSGSLTYATSKEAVRALTKTLATECGRAKIRAKTILVAATSPRALWYLRESDTYDAGLANVAICYFGTPEDVAPLEIFRASDESHYTTGITICVEGAVSCFRS